MPENGLDPTRFPIAEDWTEPGLGERFRFITVGRLVPYKGMDLILEAMAKSDVLRGCTLEIIGSGPMCGDLEDLTRRLGLEDVVGFAGALDQVELGRRLKRSQVFVFPSLREFGGAVVLEAMASGLPSIIVNYGGPAELADAACAIRLPMADRNSLINALTKGMERLAGDHALCRKLGRAAAERVGREFTWDSKAERIARIYRELLGR